jgi:hypothetical protein
MRWGQVVARQSFALPESMLRMICVGMSEHRYVLRDLPGVAELEARLHRINAHPNPLWAPEADRLDEDVDYLSDWLFGITWADSFPSSWDFPDLTKREIVHRAYELDQHFAFLDYEDEHQNPQVWAKLGWDITGKDGKPLLCLEKFDRQMVCSSHQIGGAKPLEQLAHVAAEEWAQGLAEQAEAFRRRKR